MFCAYCGTQFDGGAFCPNCGAAAEQTAQPQQNSQPVYQAPIQPGQMPIQPPVATQLSMKWYKFIINFALFAGAALNVIYGFQFLTGSIYEGNEDFVYAVFSDLEMVDKISGIAFIAIAAIAIVTRFQLAKFSKNGPKLLMVVYALNIIVPVIYMIGVSAVLPSYVAESLEFSSYIGSLAASAAMMAFNFKYFRERSHLFVN